MFHADRSFGLKQRAGTVVATLLILAALAGASSKLWQFGVPSPFTDPMHFRAFYCAGAAIAKRDYPYRVEPDRSCQRDVLLAPGLPPNNYLGLPAPLPPYALIAFAILTLLPFRSAAELWMAVNAVAVAISIVLVGKLSGSRPIFAASALFLSAGVVCRSLGQLVPIVLAAVLFAALCCRRGNGVGASASAMVCAIEPHLAFQIWLALALFVPIARKPLAIAAIVLAGVSLLPGAELTFEYLRSVIPLHARAELPNFEVQYGLSSLLAALIYRPNSR